MDMKQLLRWGIMSLAVIGLIQIIVATWAIEAKYYEIIIRGLVGDSPKIAIAAGVFLIAIAIASFFARFEERIPLLMISGFLVLALVLSIAAMGVAIRDDNDYFGAHLLQDVQKRLKAVAGISGFSAIVNIIVIGGAVVVAKDVH